MRPIGARRISEPASIIVAAVSSQPLRGYDAYPHCKGDAKRYACTAIQMAVKRLLQINNKAFRSNYLAGVKCVPQVLATRANVESVKRLTTEELGGAPRNPKQVRPAAPYIFRRASSEFY